MSRMPLPLNSTIVMDSSSTTTQVVMTAETPRNNRPDDAPVSCESCTMQDYSAY